MIVGTLDHSEQYYVLGERIKQALEFLKAHDIREMENGRYAIDGTRLSESDLYLIRSDMLARRQNPDGICRSFFLCETGYRGQYSHQ